MVDISQDREYADGDLVPGTPYRVVGLLGSGGMGLVYEVEHTLLERRFVLKTMLKSLAAREDLVARMHNELRALGRITHENIVDVSYAATGESGAPFYVMELLVGEPLSHRMRRRGRLPFEEACRIAREILLGLEEAHRIGVVHRDIKPANIFLTQAEVVKVLDFGIAKVQDGSASEATAHGLAIGTPRYMSPEQVAGSVTTAQADLYAVGLLLFEMIAGAGPFDDVGDQRKTMLAHVTRVAPRLSTRATIPSDLDALVASALAKEPEDRPASAALMAEALAHFAGPRRPGAWDGLTDGRAGLEPRSRTTGSPLHSDEPTLPKAVPIPSSALPSGDAATVKEPPGLIEIVETGPESSTPRTRTEPLPLVSPDEVDAHEQPTRTSALARREIEPPQDTPSSVGPLLLPPSLPPPPRGGLLRFSTTLTIVALIGFGAWVLSSRMASSGGEDTVEREPPVAASEALASPRDPEAASPPEPEPALPAAFEGSLRRADAAETEADEEKVEATRDEEEGEALREPQAAAPTRSATTIEPRSARAPGAQAETPRPPAKTPRPKKRILPGSGL